MKYVMILQLPITYQIIYISNGLWVCFSEFIFFTLSWHWWILNNAKQMFNFLLGVWWRPIADMPWTTSVYILQVDNTSPTVGFLLVEIHWTLMKKMWIDLSSNFEACLTKGIDWMYSCTFMKYNAHVSPIFPKKTNCYSFYGVNYIIK